MSSRCRSPLARRAVASAVLSGLPRVVSRCAGALRQRTLQPVLICMVASAAFGQDDCCAPKEEPRPPGAPPSTRILRVTSDPNNLPFSNEKREGFENKLADLIAKELGAELQYSWRAQRRGFFRETLKEEDRKSVV